MGRSLRAAAALCCATVAGQRQELRDDTCARASQAWWDANVPWAAQQLTTRDLYVSCRGEVIPFTVELRGDLENDADFVADEIFGRTACADEPLEARRAVVLEGLRDERRRPSSRSHTPLRLLRSLPDRDGLPRLLADLGYAGTGVEVGTHRGEFAAKLLNGSALSELHLVDLWAAVDFYDADRGGDVAATRAAVAPYGRRAALREGLASLDAARAFPDASLDFVYLDAEHTYVQRRPGRPRGLVAQAAARRPLRGQRLPRGLGAPRGLLLRHEGRGRRVLPPRGPPRLRDDDERDPDGGRGRPPGLVRVKMRLVKEVGGVAMLRPAPCAERRPPRPRRRRRRPPAARATARARRRRRRGGAARPRRSRRRRRAS